MDSSYARYADFLQRLEGGLDICAISRMYGFVHFPTDVLTGTILGIIEAILAGIIVRFIYRKMEEKKTKVA